MAVTSLLRPEDYRVLRVFSIYDKILGFSGYIYYKIKYEDYSDPLDSMIMKAIKSVYPDFHQAFDYQPIFWHHQEENIMRPYLIGTPSNFTIQFMPDTTMEWLDGFTGKAYPIVEHNFKFNLLLHPKSDVIQFVRKSAVAFYNLSRQDYYIQKIQTLKL